MSNDTPIYLDNHATTRVDPQIVNRVTDYLLENVGNASSPEHWHGNQAEDVINHSLEAISKHFKASKESIIFTSGATESANIIIRSAILNARNKGATSPRIIISAVEHPCIKDTAIQLEKEGLCGVEILRVDAKGRINISDLKGTVKGATLCCIMGANNEIGNIYPIEKIGAITKRAGCKYLCDATQLVGKAKFNIKQSNIDYLIFSGHKIHALPGVGCLILKDKDEDIHSLMFGGEHQSGRRPGTLNVTGILSLGLAIAHIDKNLKAENVYIRDLRDKLWSEIRSKLPEAEENGDLENKLPNNLHFSVPGIDNSMILANLYGKLSISTGSACTTGYSTEPSKVLTTMGLPNEKITGAFRIGLSRFTTNEEIDRAAELFVSAIQKARLLVS